MDFHMKLPRNNKEFPIFLGIISIISVLIIAPLITCFEMGFKMSVLANTLKVIPFIWIAVVGLVLLTHKPAEIMSSKIVAEGDSFNAKIIINTLCNVLLMSIFLTVIGSWIGMRRISLEPVIMFFHKWPRNFVIAFGVEALIAQPIARFVMVKIHEVKDKKESEVIA